MRVAIIAGALLLAGCVQQPVYVPPQPIQLQTYSPAIPYRLQQDARPPMPAPGAPLADLPPLPAAPASPADPDLTGAIPLQDMPAPAQETGNPPNAPAKPEDSAPTPVVQRPPTSGPGSSVPLEGFRPMRGQTRPTP